MSASALPSQSIPPIRVAERIVSGESLQSAVLGVTGERQDSGIGVPIAEVTEGSGAEAAGIEPGDRILTIDGVPVTNIGELTGLVQGNFTGDTVELELAARHLDPDRGGHPLLAVANHNEVNERRTTC